MTEKSLQLQIQEPNQKSVHEVNEIPTVFPVKEQVEISKEISTKKKRRRHRGGRKRRGESLTSLEQLLKEDDKENQMKGFKDKESNLKN